MFRAGPLPGDGCEIVTVRRLKPCPFCGYTEVVYSKYTRTVDCGSCGAEGPVPSEIDDDAENESIELWNTRHYPTSGVPDE